MRFLEDMTEEERAQLTNEEIIANIQESIKEVDKRTQTLIAPI